MTIPTIQISQQGTVNGGQKAGSFYDRIVELGPINIGTAFAAVAAYMLNTPVLVIGFGVGVVLVCKRLFARSTTVVEPCTLQLEKEIYLDANITQNTALINGSPNTSSSDKLLAADMLFNNADIIHYIAKFLSYENILQLLSISRFSISLSNSFKGFQVRFTPSPLALAPSPLELAHSDNERIYLRLTENLKITIRVTSSEDCQNLINFINNPKNNGFLVRIEALELGNIYTKNIKELLNLLAQKADKLKNLTSFSCGDISGTFAFPKELNSLSSFSCRDIYRSATLKLPKELNSLSSFSCRDLFQDAALTLPKELNSLSSFSCGNIYHNVQLTLPEKFNNLTNFTFGAVLDKALRERLESLRCFTLSNSKQ